MLRELTSKQEKAIAALLTEPTFTAAAKKAGVADSTIRRWMSEEVFEAAYREARRRAVEGAIGSLQRASEDAVATLERNLNSGLPSVEVRAAVSILDFAVKGVELYDIAQRVEELEAAMKERSK